MEEIIRNLGVKIESYFMACLVSTLFVCLRIYEPDTPPSRRKIIYFIIIGIIAALLVPGIVIKVTGTDDAYKTGVYTAIVVYTFELIIQGIKNKVLKKLKSEDENERN